MVLSIQIVRLYLDETSFRIAKSVRPGLTAHATPVVIAIVVRVVLVVVIVAARTFVILLIVVVIQLTFSIFVCAAGFAALSHVVFSKKSK